MQNYSPVAAREIRILIDLAGNVIETTTRDVPLSELAPLFGEAKRIGAPIVTGSELEQASASRDHAGDRGDGRKRRRVSDRDVDLVRRDQGREVEDLIGLMAQANPEAPVVAADQAARLIAEFGGKKVFEKARWVVKRAGREPIDNPVGLLITVLNKRHA